MFKTLAFATVFTSVVLAQNTTSSTNPLIPTGISDSCTTFYKNLDTDSTFGTCLKSLNSATTAFSPGGTGTVSKASVSSTLTTLCADTVSGACPESLIRTTLTNFYTSCSPELTGASKNAQVVQFYETLYLLSPMRTSICAKDDSGDYCVFSSQGTAKEQSSDVSLASLMGPLFSSAGALKRRAATAVVPNLQTYHDKNIAFLYYTPSLDAPTLCTACARQVVTAYMNFESNVAYTPGVDNSQILVNQQPLIDAINGKCPAGFLNGAVQAAGGLSGGYLSSSAAVPSVSSGRQTVLALAMGLAAIVSFF
ncbi:hypothetical protein CPB83DRAFT_875752 [Crepidotus variabilis]|uniref:DUF7729 domain-containing protein n=1 Tax=Crepidotus variabilis TaxID=179855 RepID=A0A9P6EHN9_9AGAR|nr:hypothetical protein CPB83DRAFT_875752 [Crepidotus variabilis]